MSKIGFGGMLDINITKYPLRIDILAYLVSNFDPNSWVQCINNCRTERESYITVADVNDIFVLTINPRKLIRSSINNKELEIKWKKIMGVGTDDELNIHMVLDRFKDYPDGGSVYAAICALCRFHNLGFTA